jgi:hypothetical protein
MLDNDLVFYKDDKGNIMSSGYKVNSILLKTDTPIMESLSKKYENLAVPCGLYYSNIPRSYSYYGSEKIKNKPLNLLINIGGNAVSDSDDNIKVDNDNDDDFDSDDDIKVDNYDDNNDDNEMTGGCKNIIPNDLYEKLLEMVKVDNNKKRTKRRKPSKKNKSKTKRNKSK